MAESRATTQCMCCGSDDHDYRNCPTKPRRAANRTKPTFGGPPTAAAPAAAAPPPPPPPQQQPGNFSARPQPPQMERRREPLPPREGRRDAPRVSRDPESVGPPRVSYIPQFAEDDELNDVKPSETGLHFEDAVLDETYTYTGPDKPPVIASRDFRTFGIQTQILENIKRMGWMEATPVQQYSFAAIHAKRDLMGCAKTGSGKTGAYLIPVLSSLLQRPLAQPLSGHCEPLVIVIVPTRELAVQIHNAARSLARGTVLKVSVLYGQTSVRWAEEQIKDSAIVVATPGRLKHFVSEGYVELRRVLYFVLDEADEMLSMGFESTIRELVNTPDMPTRGLRQTLMFSATFPPEIQRLASDFLVRSLFLSVGIVGNANTSITQDFISVERQADKKPRLKELVAGLLGDPFTEAGEAGLKDARILIFVERKRMADILGSCLCDWGFPAATIHGDREQPQREAALAQLVSGRARILVATSVAARGIDIPKIDVVINYDLPQTCEDYVHRIGRTGRVGHLGRATSFYVSEYDRVVAPAILKILKQSSQVVPDWLQKEARDFEQSTGYTHDEDDQSWCPVSGSSLQ